MIRLPDFRSYSTILAILIVLGGGALVIGSRDHRHSAEMAAQTARGQLDTARAHQQQTRANHRATLSALEDISILKHAGLLQKVDRLSWADTLRATETRLPLTDLHYEIGGERPANRSPEAAAKPGPLFVTPVKIRANLPHEGHFLRLIEYVCQPSALITPKRCLLSRQRKPAGTPSLSMECEIEWPSFHSPSSGDPLSGPQNKSSENFTQTTFSARPSFTSTKKNK